MTNSDNTFGTFNKKTLIMSQHDDGSTALINHANTNAAKSFFFTDAALTVFDECCTQLQWAVVDNTKLNGKIIDVLRNGFLQIELMDGTIRDYDIKEIKFLSKSH